MTLSVGDAAPDFTLKNQHGEDVTLSSLRDRNVVLVFIPFAFSGICTGELGELQANLDLFAEHDAELVAVSCDHFFTNRAFADRDGYEFSILSDFWPHGAAATAYGTFNDEAGAANRGAYVIDREGVVRWLVRKGIGDRRELDEYREGLAQLS